MKECPDIVATTLLDQLCQLSYSRSVVARIRGRTRLDLAVVGASESEGGGVVEFGEKEEGEDESEEGVGLDEH